MIELRSTAPRRQCPICGAVYPVMSLAADCESRCLEEVTAP